MQLVAECGDYSVQGLILGTAAEAQILLTANLHRDDRPGPDVVLDFVEGLHPRLLEHCQFVVLPGLKPYGFSHYARKRIWAGSQSGN